MAALPASLSAQSFPLTAAGPGWHIRRNHIKLDVEHNCHMPLGFQPCLCNWWINISSLAFILRWSCVTDWMLKSSNWPFIFSYGHSNASEHGHAVLGNCFKSGCCFCVIAQWVVTTILASSFLRHEIGLTANDQNSALKLPTFCCNIYNKW